MKRFLLALALVCPLFGTTITGPLKTPNTATPFTGRIEVTPSNQWTNIAGEIVTASPITIIVTGGNFSIDLEPTDTAVNPNNPYYTFVFYPTGGQSYTKQYHVQTSLTALTIADLGLLTTAAPPVYSYLYSTQNYVDPAWLTLTKLGSTISVVDGDIPGNLKRYANLQAAITGSATKHLWIPCGSYLSGGVTISSAIRIEGSSRDCVAVTFTGSPDIGVYITASNVEISGIYFTGTSGKAVYVDTVSRFRFHDNRVSGGGALTTGTLPLGGVWGQDSDDATIERNEFTANGPSSGAPIQNTHDVGWNFYIIRPSFSKNVRVTGNKFFSSNTAANVGLFNTSDAEVERNIIDQNNVTAGANTDGYGVMFYGSGGTSITSMSRVSNVLTAVTSTAHHFWVGAHVIMKDATPAGSSYFDGDCVVTTVSDNTHFTCSDPGPNDTATGGVVNLSPQNVTVRGNLIRNTAGNGIYMQSYTDSTVEANHMWTVGQQQSPTSLCVGGIGLQSARRVRVATNEINGSTQDGICIASGEALTVVDNTIVGAVNGINLRSYVRDSTIAKNTIEGGAQGINEPTTTTNWRLTINANTLRFQTAAGIYFLGNSNDTKFTENTILPWPGAAYGMLMGVQGGTGSHNNLISGNIFYGLYEGLRSMTTAALIFYGNNNQVSDNRLSYMQQNAIQDNSTDSVIKNNYIYGGNNYCIVSTSATRSQALNNYCISNTNKIAYSASSLGSGNKFSTGASQGSCTLASGTCTVSTTEILTGDTVRLSRQATGGTLGNLSVGTITNATSFVVNSSSASDTSVVFWEIIH